MLINKMKFKNKTKSAGFTLILSLIVVSAILTVGFGVSGIIIKQMIFSSIGRDSDVAFYAADTGIECALYWDKEKAFDSTTYSIDCANITINGSMVASTTSFILNFSNSSCVSVLVDKSSIVSPKTKIEAKGYNVGCLSTFSNKVERALRVSY